MSTTQQVSRSPQASAPAEASGGLPEASLPESLGVLVTGVVPALVRGLFSPRKGAMKLLTRVDADRRAVKRLGALRRKYDGDGVRILKGKIAILWGAGAIREVLDRSAELYASDSGAKAKGMCHFQPDALTLSRGEKWRDRRAFTEAVLATPERVHPDAPRLLRIIDDEVSRLSLAEKLTWDVWEQLFDHVTLRIIFGDRAREDQRLTALLEKLMAQSNRLVGLGGRSDDYFELYAGLERYLRDPEPGSLIARFAQAPKSNETRMVQQIPHWMFAMRDTLAANAYRALAAIVADTAIERRVREEVDGSDLTDPQAVDRLRVLEGCLHEAMRLWPTTPLLARETTSETELAGERLEAGTQVMLLNVFNHRDRDHVEDADRLVPERWQAPERDYRFNHLSNGSQDCPGGPLVLLLGKAVIGQVLQRYAPRLEGRQLTGTGSLPHMLNFFELRFTAGGAPVP